MSALIYAAVRISELCIFRRCLICMRVSGGLFHARVRVRVCVGLSCICMGFFGICMCLVFVTEVLKMALILL